MRERLILVEPFQHHEVLDALLRARTNTRPVTIITNTFCYEQSSFQSSDWADWIITEKIDQTLREFLARQQAVNTVLFTTIDIHMSYWDISSATTTLGIVHNAHNFFNIHSSVIPSPFHYLKRRFYGLRGDYKRYKKVQYRLDKILVPSSSIKQYLQPLLDEKIFSKIDTIDFAVPQHSPVVCDNEKVRITIPGTVSQEVRDYEYTLNAFSEIDKRIEQSIILCLLGRLKDDRIQSILQKLAFKHIEIEYWVDHISNQLFDQKMRSTDFLLLPIQPRIPYKSLYEIRGKTSVSGNINDMVRYAIPAILPSFYPLDRDLERMVSRYSNETELVSTVMNWIVERKHNILKERHRSLAANKSHDEY